MDTLLQDLRYGVRRIVRRLLAQSGYDVHEARDGEIQLDPNVPEQIGRIQIRGLRAFGTRWDVEAVGTKGNVRLSRHDPD